MKNLFKIIRRIFYCLVTKKMLISFIILLLALLLSSKVFAYNFNDDLVAPLPSNILSYLESTTEYQSGNYDYFVFAYSDSFFINFFPKSSTIKGYFYNTNNFKFNESFTYTSYRVRTATGQLVSTSTATATPQNEWGQYVNNQGAFHWQGSFNMYTNSSYTTVYYVGVPLSIEPYFVSTDLELGSLNTQTISINADYINQYYNTNIDLYVSTRPRGSAIGTTVYATGLSPASDFFSTHNNAGYFFDIPVSAFKDFLTAGYELTYELRWREQAPNQAQINIVEKTLIYNPDAETVDDIETLNNSLDSNFNKINNTLTQQFGFLGSLISDKFANLSAEQQERFLQQYNLQQQQYQSQQETENATKDTNQFLKNQNFDSSNLNLPQSQGNDITEDGIGNIFTMIYNAFTSGQAPDLNIPIPYTGKSFTIPANYLSTVFSGTIFAPIKSLVELFWWYMISSYIIKDIANKMRKLKSGDIENLENSNIKEDML